MEHQEGNPRARLPEEQEQLFYAILENVHDGIIAFDGELLVNYINPAAEEMCESAEKNILGKNIAQALSLLEPKSLSNLFLRGLPLAKESTFFRDAILKTPGATLIVDGSISAFSGGPDGVQGYVLVMRDISQMKKLSATIDYQASHDALTGLLNREGLVVKIDDIIDSVKRSGGEYALIQIDIDDFKKISSATGSAASSGILIQFSELLKTMIKRRDIFARIETDVFDIILIDCDVKEAAEVAERVHRVVNGRTFTSEGKEFSFTITVAVVPINEKSPFAEGILAAADAACGEAKKAGGNKTIIG
jgi:diguanylate cyclase (GGDEF)-like protein/PAS domain S-box-containing protein